MKSEWKTYKMEQVLEKIIDYRGKTPEKSNYGIPTLSAKTVKNNYIDYNNCYYISPKEYDKFMVRGLPEIGDILLTTEAPLGMAARLDRDDVAIAQRLLTLRGKKDILDNDYLLYFLQSPFGQSLLKSHETGTTVTGIKQSVFRKLEISIPPFNIQRKISVIMRILDDKIKLNTSINENLEQQAQAIFKSWFVDFEPFGGVMPDDWKIDKLGSLVEIKRGGSPRPIQEYISDVGYNWLKISDVTNLNSPYILEIKEHIKKSGINKTVMLKQGSLVLSNSATPGIPKILDIDSCIHDGWLYFPKSQLSNEYLYLLFKTIRNDLVMLGNGSVFTNLKTDILRQFKIVIPNSIFLVKFQETIKPLFDTMKNIAHENQRLSTLRDTLLPKLMSGEIDVSLITN